MPKITEMWAWVVEDDGPDDEGIPAAYCDGTWMPLVGADAPRVKSARVVAQEQATRFGKTIRLYKWTGPRELVDEVKP